MKEIAVFGGGCFWCTEAVFQNLRGVESVTSGYAGGTTDNPIYHEVTSGGTGHAEVIRVEFDPEVINYKDLLTVFFALHDPTTPNRQGADTGPQYRSIILYTSVAQKSAAEEFIKKLTDEKVFDAPIVTEVKALDKFYEAEEEHKNYYKKNPDKPYCQVVINPKVAKLRQKFAELLR
ncbi:MAG: peptide-methionine (S)-S-oxide reductase MsrA [Candidatus Doudnabacteria bacterium]|nr:peptide-methionine (S)-S-oxide reductase MsrA [Candidatus Doudnabacteria bacterium]